MSIRNGHEPRLAARHLRFEPLPQPPPHIPDAVARTMLPRLGMQFELLAAVERTLTGTDGLEVGVTAAWPTSGGSAWPIAARSHRPIADTYTDDGAGWTWGVFMKCALAESTH